VPECILTNELLPLFYNVLKDCRREDFYFPEYFTPSDNHPIASSQTIIENLKSVVAMLPAANFYFLSVFLPHLRRIANLHLVNKMGYNNLSTIFTATLSIPQELIIILTVQTDYLFPMEN
jgi:hypothetical protein